MIPKLVLLSVTAVLLYFSVLCAVFVAFLLKTGPDETPQQRTKSAVMTVFAVGALSWPLVWYISIGSVVLETLSLLPLFGALWPPVMLLLDLRGSRLNSVQAGSNNLVGHLQDDANSLIGIAFAFAMLMVATYANQKKEMYSAMLMVLFALVICIAFVVPQPLAQEGSDAAFVWAAGQRVVFSYAMGYLLTALCLSITAGSKAMASVRRS